MKISKKYLKRSFGIWIFTILLAGLFLSFVPLDISDFIGKDNKIPLEPCDIYARFVEDDSCEPDSNIVIIKLPYNANREYIARTLEVLFEAKPAVVGLDFNFENRKDSVVDDRLVKAITKFGDSIVACIPTRKGQFVSNFFDDSIFVHKALAKTFNEEYDVERTFIPEKQYPDTVIPSMAYMLSSLYPRSKYDRSIKVDERVYIYNCNSTYIKIIDADEVLKRRRDIEGKIALVGECNNNRDTHRTSISSNYPGIRIIADTTRTLINNKFIWHNSILDIVVCALILLICSFIIQWYENGDENRSDRTDIACLILQVLLLIFVIIKLGYKLYLSGIYIDFSLLLLWIIFMPIVNDGNNWCKSWWNILNKKLLILDKYKKYFKNEKK